MAYPSRRPRRAIIRPLPRDGDERREHRNRILAAEYGAMSGPGNVRKAVTVTDIALGSGVSRATVSLVRFSSKASSGC